MAILRKITIVLFPFLIISSPLLAQDKLPVKFGKVAIEDFDVRSTLIDSNTNAVVIADAGHSEFAANTNELTFSLRFKQQRRIKILNNKGFDAGTVIIPIYVTRNNAETFSGFEASTYNVDNGKITTVKVDKSSVFTEQVNENWVYKKFTFPALKEGSIIEYSYEIKSDFFFNLHDWVFQGQYPVLWSQYEVSIPEFFRFVILAQGYHPYIINKKDEEFASYSFRSSQLEVGKGFKDTDFKISGKVNYYLWAMKDIPALKEEPYTTTVANSVAKIEFQLKEVAFPGETVKPYMSTWQKVGQQLRYDDDFGQLIYKPNTWLNEVVAPVVKGVADTEAKAREIYKYIRDNFSCSNVNGWRVSTNLKEVVKNKTGTAADLNMLLIAMLRSQDMMAEPVLLSTRQHGYTSEVYPQMDKYNYLVAHLFSKGKDYYLDGATPRLGFNKLPLKVYNGQARVITKEDALPVYFLPDSLAEAKFKTVFIENGEQGAVSGFGNCKLGYFTSLNLRNEIAETGIEQYKTAVKASYPDDIEISSIDFDSLDQLEEPVELKFDFKVNGFGETDIVYFNPMLGQELKKNPFSAAERYYPVEMPFTMDDMYMLTMDIPKGYKIDELPQSSRMVLNEDEGVFEYIISADETTIRLRCRLSVSKTFFPNEDYQTLRDFYGFAVKKQAEQIVFKKIK